MVLIQASVFYGSGRIPLCHFAFPEMKARELTQYLISLLCWKLLLKQCWILAAFRGSCTLDERWALWVVAAAASKLQLLKPRRSSAVHSVQTNQIIFNCLASSNTTLPKPIILMSNGADKSMNRHTSTPNIESTKLLVRRRTQRKSMARKSSSEGHWLGQLQLSDSPRNKAVQQSYIRD
jgi:hypothetical protein